MDEFDPDATDGSRDLICSTFLACHTLWYDNTNPDAGFSLGRVVVHVRPPDGSGFPIRLARLFLFLQLHGTPDEYVLRVRLLRTGVTDDGTETETELRHFGPWEVVIPGDNYVECFGFQLANVYLPDAGVYEFQLWADGGDAPIGRERIQARE